VVATTMLSVSKKVRSLSREGIRPDRRFVPVCE